MWQPLSLEIVNLFAYEATTLTFEKNQITTIYGINNTDVGVKSNGSGKTSILDCIALSMIGEPLRDVSKKEIIRNTCSSGHCFFTMVNSLTQDVVRIETYVNATKSNNVHIYENEVLNTNLKDLNPAESYKYITSLIGISKEDLKNYFLISKDSYKSFFLSGDTARKEIINRFSKADIVDKVDPLLKEDIASIDAKLNDFALQKASNESALNIHNEELTQEELESSIEKTRKLTIQALEERRDTAKKLCDELPSLIEAKEKEIKSYYEQSIVPLEESLVSIQEDIDNLNKQVESLNKEYGVLEHEQDVIGAEYEPLFSEKDTSILQIEDQIAESRATLKEVNHDISHLEGKMAGEISCPKCSHNFILSDKEFDLEDAKERLVGFQELKADIEKEIADYQLSISKLNEEKRELSEKLKVRLTASKEALSEKTKAINQERGKINLKRFSLTETENKLSNNNRTLNNLKGELGVLDGKASYYIQQIDNCNGAIEKEKEKVYPDKTASLRVKIKDLQEAQANLQKEIEEYENDKKTLLEWQVRFKQFKSFLANSSINSIEDISNFFLEKMRTNLRVSIEGFRELSNKKLKEEITMLVVRDGLNGESFSKFSGGEKAKIDLACILAMQKIINLSTEDKGLNLLFLDEILESVDAEALTNVVKGLAALEQTIFLITHVEQNNFEGKKILVEKTNGISKAVSLS